MARKQKDARITMVPGFAENVRRIEGIIASNKKIRVRIGFQFLDPADSIYYTIRGQSVTFDSDSADMVIGLPALIKGTILNVGMK